MEEGRECRLKQNSWIGLPCFLLEGRQYDWGPTYAGAEAVHVAWRRHGVNCAYDTLGLADSLAVLYTT